MPNYVGMPIIFDKDDPTYANDLSFMTDEDWAELAKAWNEQLKRMQNKS